MMTTNEPRQLRYREAINEAITEEMRRDPKIIVYGEDVGTWEGIFGVTRGLLKEFGPERVVDMPISEQAIAGTAIGLAITGYRPIAEIMFLGMIGCCFDGVFFKMGNYKQMWGLNVPAIIRGGVGGSASGEHAYSPEAILQHSPGLQIVLPSTPYDAKGLMKTACRGEDPVIFCEHIDLYAISGPVPEEEYIVPFGQADIKREGKDVTVITYSGMVRKVLEAAESLAKEGIEAEVVDLRTLVPLDEEAILSSVKKTGKVVIAHESMERGGPAGELTSIIADKAFDYLDAPVKRVAALNSMIPGGEFNKFVLPQTSWIINAIKSLFASQA